MRGFGKLGAVSVLSADSVIMGTGFGVALSAMEAHRYPVISSVGSSMFLNSNDVAIAFLAACCVYYAVRRGGPPRLRAAMPVASVLASLTFFLYGSACSGVDLPVALQVFSDLHMGFGVLLMVLWMEEFVCLRRDEGLDAMVVGLLSTFVVQASIVLLDEGMALGACAMLPVLSALLFALHRQRKKPALGRADPSDGGGTQGAASASPDWRRLARLAPTCVALLFCGLLFNVLNRMWRSSDMLASGEVSVQLFSALGSLAAGVLLLLIRRPIGRGIVEAFVAVFALVALLMSSQTGGLFYFYLAPLNVSLKLIFVLLLTTAYRVGDPRLGMMAFCGMYASYRVGLAAVNSVYALLQGDPLRLAPEASTYVVIVAGSVCLLVFAVVELMHLHDHALESQDGAAAEVDQETIERYKSVAFHFFLAQRFSLTQREAEIVPLIERGMNAKAISEELVISQLTAKSHLRNIYTKMGVHSQKEALVLVEAEREGFFGGGAAERRCPSQA